MDISLLGQLNMSPFHLITHSITLSESDSNWILIVAQYFAKMIWCKVSTVSCSTRNPGKDKLRITFTFILTLTFLYWVLSVGGVHILLMKRKGRITSPANWILFCFQDFTFQRKVLFCTKAKYKKPLFGCGFDTEDKPSCLLQIRESVVECWMEK